MPAQARPLSPAAADRSTALPKLSANHARNCKICRHPDRRAIEHLFMESCSAGAIALHFGFCNRQNVYRHAVAAGLYDRRRRKMLRASERVLENVGFMKLTGDAFRLAFEHLEQHVRAELEAESQALAQASALTTIRPIATPAVPLRTSLESPISRQVRRDRENAEVIDSKHQKNADSIQDSIFVSSKMHRRRRRSRPTSRSGISGGLGLARGVWRRGKKWRDQASSGREIICRK